MIPRPSTQNRHVFLDVLTTATHLGASPVSDRICVISTLVDDGIEISEPVFLHEYEPWILSRFWESLKAGDLVIGLKRTEETFDFLRQRSLVLGVAPTDQFELQRWYSHEVIDIVELWSNWVGQPQPDLSGIPDAIDRDRALGRTLKKLSFFEEGDLSTLYRACRDEVRLTLEAWCCLTSQRVPDRYHRCSTVINDLQAIEHTVRCHE